CVGGGRWVGVVGMGESETEVGEINQIALGKSSPPFHRGKNRAVSFAVAAGIADCHLPLAFFDQLRQRHGAPPPAPRSVRRRNRWSIQNRRDSLCRECYQPSLRLPRKYFLPAARFA